MSASSILLLADMHLQGGDAGPPESLWREVRRLAARTLALSEDFVRAAQAQTQALQNAPVALADLLDEALSDLRPQAAMAGVLLQADIAEPADTADKAMWPVLDRLLVARAIANLVSNAVKHSPRGSAVQVQAACADGRLQVRVRDHGAGLSAPQLAQLAQGEQGAAVRDARGVGLGLLFVQRVARRHGGQLRAFAPAEGAGACFELELPA
jgi:signal transduction histidine kinase